MRLQELHKYRRPFEKRTSGLPHMDSQVRAYEYFAGMQNAVKVQVADFGPLDLCVRWHLSAEVCGAGFDGSPCRLGLKFGDSKVRICVRKVAKKTALV